MKRINILTTPTAVANLKDLDMDWASNTWQIKAERLQARRMRKFKQSWM